MLIFDKITGCADETELVGAELANFLESNGFDYVAMYGGLGAGKTAFTRGFASVITPGAEVCSPTYTVVNEYEGRVPLYHFDMYRIEDEDSLESIGYYDYVGRGIIITEWSENVPFALPDRYIKVEIQKIGENSRRITAETVG